MAVIVVGNLKGGAGKTTLAVSLSCALPGRVVLIDADPQASAVMWGAAGGLPVEVLALPLTDDGEGATRAWLERVMGTGADTVVVDLPPALGTTTTAALAAADLLIVPVAPSALDLHAAAKTLTMLRQARQIRRGGKPAGLLVPSRVDRRTAAGREIEAVLHDMGEPVAPAIAQRAAHADAAAAGQWIGAYAPRTAAHVEIQAFTALVQRMIRP